MSEVLSALDFSPLIISLQTGIVATTICFFLGLYSAGFVLRIGEKARAIIDAVFTMPMVLPPTVAGFFLLLLFSKKRSFGMMLYDNFHITVVQTWAGCVIAASVIAFPLMYKNARAAFEQVDINLIYAARTLGITERKIFWKIIMPEASPGIVSGTVLTFARAMGEYGATAMLAGNISGKTGTVSQKIAMVMQDGDYVTAGIWAGIILICSLIAIWSMNLFLVRKRKRMIKW